MGKKTGIRFFRWIKSDLPDCDPNPVLLLSITKLNTSPTIITTPSSATLTLQRPHTIFYDRTPIVPDTFDADDNNLPPNKSQLYDIKKRCDSYIDKIPEILENKKIIKNSKLILNNNGKIGQTTSSSSSSIALPPTQKLDRNSNGNQTENTEHQTTPKLSSLEYSKIKNLTKIDNDDKNTNTTTAASRSAHTVSKPKVLITRIKQSSDKIIENIIIDDYNYIKSTTTTSNHNNKKSSNCKIYNFMPKCTRRNDSTEPESLSSEETNNNLELNKTPTNNNKLLLNTKNSYNSSVIMDRSVDSIGSCSLDVDADSTDFSDTSGSLNLVTPSSGKDINKDFIARFQERCHFVPQTTTTVLDPCSGKVTTVLSSPVTDTPATIKKPSYLNLACCVNGYSNLTTYDSKLRQNINKSREVSPIRPITHSLQYNRESGNNYLVVPVPVPKRIDAPKMDSSEPHRSYMSNEKRIFTSQMLNDNNGSGAISGKDVVDDASSAARYKGSFMTTSKYVTTSNSTIKISSETDTPTKSFIQQSVERLYGPGALATLYTHKRGTLINNNTNHNNNHSNNGHLTDGNGNLNGSNILAEKYLNNIISSQHHENNIYNNYTATKLNGHSTIKHHYENNENIKTSHEVSTSIAVTPAAATVATPSPPSPGALVPESLPVLRHLRPEFRAQLPISPKKSMTRVLSSNTEISINNNVHNNNNNNKLMTSTIRQPSTINTARNNTSATIMTTKDISNSPIAVEKTKNGVLLKYDDNDGDNHDNNHELNKIKTEKNIEINKNMFSCNQANGGDVIAHKNHINHTNNSNDYNLIEKKVLIMDNNEKNLINNNNNNINNNSNLKLNGDNNIIINNGDSCDKDGNYFLIILKDKQNRLLELANQTEKDIEALAESSDVSDEILGYLRSASGKARLLATKKMKQFEGLCHSNLNLTPEGEFPTTSGDLQGFWDMVMLQVNHVDSLFKEIESWKANNWKKPVIAEIAPPQGTKLPKRPIPLKTPKQNGSNKSEAAALAAQKREAQRKQLAEIRRQNKTKLEQQQQLERQQQQENGIEIFIAGGSTS